MNTSPKSTSTNPLREAITKCFRDTYMETEGETELFDTEETITALEELLTAKTAEALRGASECWLWAGVKSQRQGYGRISVGGRVQQAHRVVYEALVAEIPEGYYLCHHCDTPACINPEHMFVGTQSENMADMFN